MLCLLHIYVSIILYINIGRFIHPRFYKFVFTPGHNGIEKIGIAIKRSVIIYIYIYIIQNSNIKKNSHEEYSAFI